MRTHVRSMSTAGSTHAPWIRGAIAFAKGRAWRGLIAWSVLQAVVAAQSPDRVPMRADTRAHAVEVCRDGDVEAGLEILRVLYESDPSDRATQAAYVVELHHAGRYQRVVDLMPALDLDRSSDEVLDAVSRSLHQLGRRSEGDAVWSRIEQRRLNDSERERAVGLARNGKLSEGLARLRTLHEIAPSDQRVRDDYLVVSNWAGDDAQAARLGAEVDRETAPTYVLEALGRSLRNERRYAEAADVYRAVVTRTPERWEARLGLAYALAESEQDDAARAELVVLAAEQPFNREALLGRATVHRWIGEPFEALGVLDQLARLDPDDAVAHRLRVHTLIDLGAVTAAAAEAERRPDAMTPADRELLKSRRASQLTQWGSVSATDVPGAANDSDRALALVDELLANAKDPSIRNQARSNRLIAWRDRGRMRDVVQAFEADEEVRVDPDALTPQAWTAVADAYAAEREPAQAVAGYRRALGKLRESSRDRYEATVGLFYALLREEEYDEAAACIDELAAAEPAWLSSYGGTPRENPFKLGADRHATVLLAWSDRLDEAGDVLERRVERAPYNVDLRADLAAVDVWRSWPSKALDQAQMALSVDPKHAGARIALARAYLGLREYDAAEREVRTLAAAQPDNPLVRELRQDWDVHESWELDAALFYGKSSNNGVFGVRDWGAEAHLYTRPLDHYSRAFVHGLAAVGEYDEGISRLNRVGVGLEHERRYWNARGEIYNSWQREADGIESALGFDVGLGFTPGDHWSFGGKYESDSLELPMRARLGGVDGDRFALEADYSASDRTQISLELGRLDMSDDNVRDTGVLSLSQRLITLSHYKLTVAPHVYASKNSLDVAQAVYFNPKHDYEFGLDATNEWLGSRHHDESWTHRLIGSLAVYDQDGFDAGWTGGLRYEQELRTSRATSYTYGIGVASYLFDGEREGRAWVYLQPNWRF